MLEPPPEPPRPGLSPPEGDMASDPLPPVPAFQRWSRVRPTTRLQNCLLFPPAPLGGARSEPTSPGPPRPLPFCRSRKDQSLSRADGGGGTTLLAKRDVRYPSRRSSARSRAGEPWPAPEPLTDGGGGMTFDAPREDWPELFRKTSLPLTRPLEPTDGWWRRNDFDWMPRASDVFAGAPPVPELEFPRRREEAERRCWRVSYPARRELRPMCLRRFAEETDGGGGGTTSCVPKSLPMMVLTKDPLLACVGRRREPLAGGTDAAAFEAAQVAGGIG
jgi:hypothetical protein